MTGGGRWRRCEPILRGLIHDVVKDLPGYAPGEAGSLVARVAAHLNALPAYHAGPLRLYLRVFDLSTIPTHRRRFSALDEAAREHRLRAVERFFPLWGTVMSLLRPVTLLCYFDCFPLNPDRAA